MTYRDLAGDQVISEAISILNGNVNFAVVGNDSRAYLAYRYIDVKLGTEHPDANGYTWENQPVENDAVWVAINPNKRGGTVGGTINTIIHETLHLDKEIDAARDSALNSSAFAGLTEAEKQDVLYYVEHKLIRDVLHGIDTVSDDYRAGSRGYEPNKIADSIDADRGEKPINQATEAAQPNSNVAYNCGNSW